LNSTKIAPASTHLCKALKIITSGGSDWVILIKVFDEAEGLAVK
jgi:hypothetical protein